MPLWALRGPIRDYPWVPIIGTVLVLAVVVAVGYSLRGLFTPAGLRTPPSYPTPVPTPAGLEFGRAYLFWYNAALPAVVSMNRTVPAINTHCRGTLPSSCRTAIKATDRRLQSAISIINKGNIPACIQDDLTRFKGDLAAMDGGLQIALQGYAPVHRSEIAQGLAQFYETSRVLGGDGAAVAKDVKALCH